MLCIGFPSAKLLKSVCLLYALTQKCIRDDQSINSAYLFHVSYVLGNCFLASFFTNYLTHVLDKGIRFLGVSVGKAKVPKVPCYFWSIHACI